MPSYNPRLKSWHTFPLLQYLSGKFISSSPSLQFNVVYRDEVTIARSQHCLGGEGIPYSSDVIRYCLQNGFFCYLIQVCQGLLSWIVAFLY